jgi:hypothetical protein
MMRKSNGVLILGGVLLIAACGKMDGSRGSLMDHNKKVMTEYKLVPDASSGTRVVEAGSGYEGKVRIKEVENKIRFLQVAMLDTRDPQSVEVQFEPTPAAKSALFSALTESGQVAATKGTWLHEKAATAFRGRSLELTGPSRIVSFKSLPLTLYSDKGEPLTRPPGIPRRGKL